MDRNRIWKEKVADSKISGYVWTGSHLFIHSFIHSHADDSAHRALLPISKSHMALAITSSVASWTGYSAIIIYSVFLFSPKEH